MTDKMARLTISLFGAFEVSLAGEPIIVFEYDKVRALLAQAGTQEPGALDHLASSQIDPTAGKRWPDCCGPTNRNAKPDTA